MAVIQVLNDAGQTLTVFSCDLFPSPRPARAYWCWSDIWSRFDQDKIRPSNERPKINADPPGQ